MQINEQNTLIANLDFYKIYASNSKHYPNLSGLEFAVLTKNRRQSKTVKWLVDHLQNIKGIWLYLAVSAHVNDTFKKLF